MRSAVFFVPFAALGAALAIAAVTTSGCSVPSSDVSAPDAFAPDANDDSKIQGIEVRDDATPTGNFCGEEQLCDPDVPAVCMTLVTDASDSSADSSSSIDSATDSSAADTANDTNAGDTANDTTAADVGEPADVSETGAASTSACRVVLRENRSIAACAPAGKVAERSFCASDDDCAPGLACVGAKGDGKCLRYCCAAFKDVALAAASGAGTHYCTLKPLAARPSDKVPVWVNLDNCTLLDDALQCLEGSTCTVVTNDGHTSCVPVGSARDYSSCADEPCDRGYVCLGSVDRRCRKLCKESEGASACASGAYCQRTPTIPKGFGICAGGDAGAK